MHWLVGRARGDLQASFQRLPQGRPELVTFDLAFLPHHSPHNLANLSEPAIQDSAHPPFSAMKNPGNVLLCETISVLVGDRDQFFGLKTLPGRRKRRVEALAGFSIDHIRKRVGEDWRLACLSTSRVAIACSKWEPLAPCAMNSLPKEDDCEPVEQWTYSLISTEPSSSLSLSGLGHELAGNLSDQFLGIGVGDPVLPSQPSQSRKVRS